MELTQETLQFIQEHLHEDVPTLRLRFAGKDLPGVDIPFALTQIEARRKTAKKLPKALAHPEFIFPTTLAAEQSTSERLAEFHASLLTKGDRILDLTAGLGIDAMAMAGGASHVTACELQAGHVRTLRHNARVMGINNLDVEHIDALEFLRQRETEHWDVIFIDPARRDGGGGRTYALADCTPNIAEIMPLLKGRTETILIKASPMLDLTQTIRELPEISELYILSVNGECKELFLKCAEREEQRQIHTLNFLNDGTCQELSFSDAERNECNFAGELNEGDYLYEPNASLMKVIQYAPINKYFPSLRQLAQGTWLYTSAQLYPDFPGRITRITAITGLGRRETADLRGKQFNIVTRNFPLSPTELKKRLRARDGGESFLYGVRTTQGQRLLQCIMTFK